MGRGENGRALATRKPRAFSVTVRSCTIYAKECVASSALGEGCVCDQWIDTATAFRWSRMPLN